MCFLSNRAAEKQFLAQVSRSKLSGRYRALRPVEIQINPLLGTSEGGLFERLAVTDPGFAGAIRKQLENEDERRS